MRGLTFTLIKKCQQQMNTWCIVNIISSNAVLYHSQVSKLKRQPSHDDMCHRIQLPSDLLPLICRGNNIIRRQLDADSRQVNIEPPLPAATLPSARVDERTLSRGNEDQELNRRGEESLRDTGRTSLGVNTRKRFFYPVRAVPKRSPSGDDLDGPCRCCDEFQGVITHVIR